MYDPCLNFCTNCRNDGGYKRDCVRSSGNTSLEHKLILLLTTLRMTALGDPKEMDKILHIFFQSKWETCFTEHHKKSLEQTINGVVWVVQEL